MSYRDEEMTMGKWITYGVIALVVLFACGIFFLAGNMFGYYMHNVGENQIGVKLKESRVVEVLPPGIYSAPFDMWADIVDVKVEGVPFSAVDPEVLTRDKQRIGLKVSGTVHRPDFEQGQVYFDLWNQYRTLYTNDEALVGKQAEDGSYLGGLMIDLTQQAMKVCVGDRNFDQAAVGEARDELKGCITDEVNDLAGNFGLVVKNVTVPNIIIGESVQKLLDEITQAKFETSRSEQQALKAKAEADRLLAEEQGRIRVEQGRIQEQLRQEKISADLERQKIEASLAVIEARKINELREAELNKAVTEAELQVELVKAQIGVAEKMAVAKVLEENPAYAQYLIAQFWSGAWGEVDKIIVPAGTNVNSVLDPNNGNMTTVVDASNP